MKRLFTEGNAPLRSLFRVGMRKNQQGLWSGGNLTVRMFTITGQHETIDGENKMKN